MNGFIQRSGPTSIPKATVVKMFHRVLKPELGITKKAHPAELHVFKLVDVFQVDDRNSSVSLLPLRARDRTTDGAVYVR